MNFHKQDEEELGEISVAQAKEYMAEGQFEANTMLPKIQASVEFVEQGEGKKAVITSIDKAVDAYLGRTGTVICLERILLFYKMAIVFKMKCFEDGSSFFDFQGDAGMAWEPGCGNVGRATLS